MRFNRVIFLLMAAVVFPAVADAQDYKIKLIRPDKVGDQYELIVNAKLKLTSRSNFPQGPAAEQEAGTTAELTGQVKILEVGGDKSVATKLSCKVTRLTDKGKEVYPAGTVIVCTGSGKDFDYLVDGKQPEPQKAAFLRLVLSMTDSTGKFDDDTTMGTVQQQKVGGTWPIDKDNTAKDMTGGNFPVSADEVSGEGRLVKTRRMNGTAIMEVSVKGTATAAGEKNMPDGTILTAGTITEQSTYVLPVDETQKLLSVTSKSHMEMTLKTPDGKGSAVKTFDYESTEQRNPM